MGRLKLKLRAMDQKQHGGSEALCRCLICWQTSRDLWLQKCQSDVTALVPDLKLYEVNCCVLVAQFAKNKPAGDTW